MVVYRWKEQGGLEDKKILKRQPYSLHGKDIDEEKCYVHSEVTRVQTVAMNSMSLVSLALLCFIEAQQPLKKAIEWHSLSIGRGNSGDKHLQSAFRDHWIIGQRTDGFGEGTSVEMYKQ